MSSVSEVFQRHGYRLDDKVLVDEIDRALSRAPGRDAEPMTLAEREYLAAYGGAGARGAVAGFDPARAHARRAALAAHTAAELRDTTASLDEAASILNIDRTRVSHRIRRGELWAVTVGGRRRIPTWQITDHSAIPRLAEVIPAIPAEAHPLDVQSLMTTPQDELAGRSPVAHLVGGGDSAPVCALLVAIDRW